MRRYEVVDMARAIAIILVVIGHYRPAYAPDWYSSMIDIIYLFHIPVFMFLSGFVYATQHSKTKSYGGFVWDKVQRLMVPYLAISILVISLKLVGSLFLKVAHEASFCSFLEIFYLPAAGFYLWFCWALFQIFAIVHLLKTRIAYIVTLVVSLLLNIYICIAEVAVTDLFALNMVVRMLPVFLLGVLAGEYKEMFQTMFRHPKSVTVVGWGIVLCSWKLDLYPNVLASLAGVIATWALSEVISESKNKATSYLKERLMHIAAAAYTIFLLHTTFEGFITSLSSKLFGESMLASNVYFAIFALLIISCGVVCPYVLHHYLLSKYRVTQILVGIKK
ncbi:MAG: acyltransferase [Alistipes sp.]|nr:acyltransferase [Alistipes sp.]